MSFRIINYNGHKDHTTIHHLQKDLTMNLTNINMKLSWCPSWIFDQFQLDTAQEWNLSHGFTELTAINIYGNELNFAVIVVNKRNIMYEQTA
jgi:hypothetical protein